MKGQSFYVATGVMLALIMASPLQLLAGDIEANLPDSNNTSAFEVTNSLDQTLLKVQSGGRAGIGATNPGAKLEVNFNSSTTTPHVLLYEDQDSGYARLSFENHTTNRYFTIAGKPDLSGSLSLLNFYYNNYGNIMTLTGSGNVGIGTTDPGTFKLWVSTSKSSGHTARIVNTNTGSKADVLALKVGATTPGNDNNFITFQKSGNNPAGNIDGNGSGGVRYNTSGSDLSEWLPRLQAEEVIEPGDIVGITGGKITKVTENADYIQVVSTAPGWVGNCPSEEKEHLYEQVAFLGQAPIRVRGTVQAGDFIVPSGLNDGVGMAVSPEKLTAALAVHVVGKAWEDSSKESVKQINTAVGLHTAARPLHSLNTKMDQEISRLTRANDELRTWLAVLERQIASIQKGLNP